MENGQLRGKVLRARHLIVERGLTIRETADFMNLTYDTVNAWYMENNWREQIAKQIEKVTKLQLFLNDFDPPESLGSHEMETKKFLAGYMVMVKLLEQKQVAKILMVSTNTVSKWSQDGQWRKKVKEALRNRNYQHSIAPKKKLADTDHFLEWLRSEFPRYYPFAQQLYNRYLNSLQERIDKVIAKWEALAIAHKKGDFETVKKLGY